MSAGEGNRTRVSKGNILTNRNRTSSLLRFGDHIESGCGINLDLTIDERDVRAFNIGIRTDDEVISGTFLDNGAVASLGVHFDIRRAENQIALRGNRVLRLISRVFGFPVSGRQSTRLKGTIKRSVQSKRGVASGCPVSGRKADVKLVVGSIL